MKRGEETALPYGGISTKECVKNDGHKITNRQMLVFTIAAKNCEWDFPGGLVVKNLLANAGDPVQSLLLEGCTCCGAPGPMCHNTEAERPRASLCN